MRRFGQGRDERKAILWARGPKEELSFLQIKTGHKSLIRLALIPTIYHHRSPERCIIHFLTLYHAVSRLQKTKLSRRWPLKELLEIVDRTWLLRIETLSTDIGPSLHHHHRRRHHHHRHHHVVCPLPMWVLQRVVSSSLSFNFQSKCKAIPLQALTGPEGYRRLRFPDFKTIGTWHRQPLPPGYIPGIHICKRLSRPQGHSAAGRIISMTNSNDTIGNRSRDLPVCSAVSQPLRHRVPSFNFQYLSFIFRSYISYTLYEYDRYFIYSSLP
jgi:hypothetical protein